MDKNMKSQQKLGDNIKTIRKKIGLTQKQVAKKAGINTNYYARIERGEINPSFETIEKIVKALKIKSSKILPF